MFDFHGWGAVHEQWVKLLEQGETSKMAELVDDEMLHAFAVVAEPRDVARRMAERFAGNSDRVSVMTPYPTSTELWSAIANGMTELTAPA